MENRSSVNTMSYIWAVWQKRPEILMKTKRTCWIINIHFYFVTGQCLCEGVKWVQRGHQNVFDALVNKHPELVVIHGHVCLLNPVDDVID